MDTRTMPIDVFAEESGARGDQRVLDPAHRFGALPLCRTSHDRERTRPEQHGVRDRPAGHRGLADLSCSQRQNRGAARRYRRIG